MLQDIIMTRIGNRSVEVSVDDEVQIAADLPGVWLRVLGFGPRQAPDNNPAVFLRMPDGRSFRSGAGAIVKVWAASE